MKERTYLLVQMPKEASNQTVILDHKTRKGRKRTGRLLSWGGHFIGTIKSPLTPDELIQGFRGLPKKEKAAPQNGTL